MNAPQVRAFVIGPIGDKDAEDGSPSRIAYEDGIQVLEDVISPACSAFGVEMLRSDMIARAGEITEQVFRLLRDSPLVIADLTGANPNVMYELGLRHTTGKLTIQIGERGRLPFDVAAIRTIMFKRTEAGLVQARKELAKALAENLDSGGDPVTATRVWFESSAEDLALSTSASAAPTDTFEPEDEDAPGFLELLAEMETGLQSLSQTVVTAASVTEDVSRIYSDATSRVADADSHGGGISARLAVVNRAAALLEDPATRMQVVAGEYEATVKRVEPGLQYLIARLSEDPSQLKETPDFPNQLRHLVEAAAGSVDGARSMGKNSIEIGKAARSLRKVGQRLANSFYKFATASERISSWKSLLERFPPSSDA